MGNGMVIRLGPTRDLFCSEVSASTELRKVFVSRSKTPEYSSASDISQSVFQLVSLKMASSDGLNLENS